MWAWLFSYKKSVSMSSLADHLAAPSFPFSPDFISWLVCTLRLEEAPWSCVGLGQPFPGAAALGLCRAGQKSQEWQETLRRVQGGRQLQLKGSGVDRRAVTAQRERDLHSDVTWRRKRALLGWQEQGSFRAVLLTKGGCECRNPTCLGWNGLVTN